MNGKKRSVLGLVAVMNLIGVLVAGNVMADEGNQQQNFLQVKVGMFQPTSDLDDAGYDTGGNIAIAYDRYLSRYLILEGAIDLSATENNDLSGNTAATGKYDLDNTLAVSSVLVTLKGEYPLGPVSVFGGAGGGIYGVTLNSEIDSETLGTFTKDDTDAVFGVQVTAGANYDVTERIFVGIEGTYRWTDEVKMNKTVASVPVMYSGDLDGYSVTVNTGFRF
ncbi:MAG: porin family protein [Proteobacteria bacterium]|nr:porin family protein [Pseudomonadota bacterium]MBU1687244.1 porin family protein [Pseudomonadota bacterium]